MMKALLRVIQAVGVEPFARDHPDHEKTRSPKWPAVRRAFLMNHPACVVSGLKSELDVHHVIPFHVDRTLELVTSNLRTVSRPYHFLLGHLCDWGVYNPDFDMMVRELRVKIIAAKRAR